MSADPGRRGWAWAVAWALLMPVVAAPAAHAQDPVAEARNGLMSMAFTNAPTITSGPADGAVVEHAEGDTAAVADYAATDLDAGTTIVWSLSGDDAGRFSVDADGAVTFDTAPDYERADDANTDNDYEVTVVAADGVGPGALSDSRDLTVRVTGVNETPLIFPYLTNDTVEENSTGSTEDSVPVAYTAADPEGDELVWTLGGDDADIFEVLQLGSTPVYAITFKEPPDFENPQSASGDNTYTFTVSVGDSNTNTHPLDVSVTVTNVSEVTDVNETPQISPYLTNDTVEENSTGSTEDSVPVAYTAADPEGDELVWTLGGDDADIFEVLQLGSTPVYTVTFKEPPDFENPQSAGGDNTYTFTVSVGDSNTSTAPRDVSVTVTNIDEDGTLAIPSSTPQVGITHPSRTDRP